MPSILNLFKTLRNNWKKTIFFSGVALYGVKYGHQKYYESLLREAYCKEAQKYGDVSLRTGERTKKITVFLNPAANNGKGKELFDKNIAPLLYLAGLEVTIVKTEYEGQAKQYMDVLGEGTADVVLVAGGDGTLSEVVTGLLRRADQDKVSAIPVGALPVGETNTLARSLFHQGENNVRWMLESAMSVIKGVTKSVDVMKIKGEEDKIVYAVTGLEWSAYRDAERRKKKYWYFGPLKDRWTYLMASLKTWPPLYRAKLTYQPPCEGCSKCYIPPPALQWRWWHLLAPPKIPVPKKDYSSIVNEECGKVYEKDIATVELLTSTHNHKLTEQDFTAMDICQGLEDVSKTDFIKEGWKRINGDASVEQRECVQASRFTLTPNIPKEQEVWYRIDNEDFEAMPVEVELLRNKLNVFYDENREEPSVQLESELNSDKQQLTILDKILSFKKK